MASGKIWVCSRVWGQLAFHPSRCCSIISQLRHQEVLQRQRATSFEILARKPEIQRSFVERLREPSTPSLNQQPLTLTNCLTLNPLSSFQFRNFHTEQQQKPKNERNNSQEDDSHKNASNKIWMIMKYGCYAVGGSLFLFSFPKFEIQEKLYHATKNFLITKHIQIEGLFRNSYDMFLLSIFMANIAVFALWRLPKTNMTLLSYFLLHNPTYKGFRSASMLLSAFSHKSFFHLLINMFVLKSFVYGWMQHDNIYKSMQPQGFSNSTTLAAFYIAAAVTSSWGSLVVKTLGNLAIPSLGASGAIMALLAYVCTKSPQSKLMIAFIPNWTFTAESGLKGLAIFDTIGLIVAIATRWRYYLLDHAGHLSGLLFGLWYAKYGDVIFYRWSEFVAEKIKPRK